MRSPRTSSQTPTLDPSPSAGNYTFTTYLAYTLYPPLYLAGPIMSYPSFVSQLAAPSPTSSPAAPVSSPSPRSETSPLALLSYATRFLVCLFTMELVLHYMHVVALKDSGSGWWDGLSAAEVSMVGFWNLIVVWLKVRPPRSLTVSGSARLEQLMLMLRSVGAAQLLLPWRLFRLWALMDGISPPENMVRCMANNYSTLGFWRSWHRSYNMWVVRCVSFSLFLSSLSHCADPGKVRLKQVPLHPAGRVVAPAPSHARRLHLCRAVARPPLAPPRLGLGHHALHRARDARTALLPRFARASLPLSSSFPPHSRLRTKTAHPAPDARPSLPRKRGTARCAPSAASPTSSS